MDTLSLQLLQAPHEGRSRMATALLLSLAAHGALLLWHSGLLTPPRPSPTSLEVTLVNSRSDTPPLRPQALAQQSLNGGGNAATGLAASPLPRTVDSTADEQVLEALHRRQAELEAEQKRLLTQLEAHEKVAASRPNRELLGQSSDPGNDDREQESLILNARIAAIKEQIEHYNAEPRQTFVGPATQAVGYAQYVEAWRRRIELIGTEHYPPEARGKIYGDLQLTVYIRSNGQLDHIAFDQPSSHAVLNSAARRIVELAAPFDPFPAELAKKTDILAITRTWHFTHGGLETGSP
ncbi:MAG TPA: energy transducer TonB [Castellaniella sp.]|uniref:energy transducer TonB n=1 Tax=Castellaniella sp. TaxID=1955812 RepID=UPI002F08E437